MKLLCLAVLALLAWVAGPFAARAGEADVVAVEAVAEGGGRVRVTQGQFVYVALDGNGRPRPVPDREDRA